MTDLEQRLRDTLEEEGRAAPAPHDVRPTLRRVRRRQTLTVLGSVAAVVAIVAVGFAGVTALTRDDESIPAAPTTTETLNGISITYPTGWSLIDPDAAGLNGAGNTDDLPRLVLFLSSAPADETLACPAMDGGAHRWFVLSVQEEPLALADDAVAPWPVEPATTRTLSDASCYPGWEFLEAQWTYPGHTYDGRIGIAPGVDDDDRQDVLDAFASMTFEPAAGPGPAAAAALAAGEVAGESWELVASRDAGGLELSVNTDSGGAGIGGFEGSGNQMQLTTLDVGSGDDASTIVFGAVSSSVASLELDDLTSPGPTQRFDPIDVPEELDRALDAFVVVVPRGAEGSITAYDGDGNVVASEPLDGSQRPVETSTAALTDGFWFGFVRGVDVQGRTITFDAAEWLTGREADAAWQAEGNTGSVPNDYFVRNEDPATAILPLAPDAAIRLLNWNHCCESFFHADLGTWAEAIASGRDIERDGAIYRGVSSWWIVVHDGVVTRIDEQYTP